MKKLLLLLICISFSFLNAQETINLYITDGNDDAYQLYNADVGWPPVGEMFVDAENLFMGHSWEPGRYYKIGLRYQSVPIPQGSTIESAYIQFYAYEANSDTTGIKVSCEKNPNPLPFTSVDYNISDRENTHSELWAVSEWQAFVPGPNQRTHNIKSIVQKVIDMEGWVKNNPMVFRFSGTSNYLDDDYPKAACSWEFGGEFYAPVLTITYTAPASVDEQELAKALNIFPNPVSDNFTISFDELKEGEYDISLFDLQGKQLHQIHDGWLSQGDHHFELSAMDINMPQGVYLLSISGNKHVINRKIIIQ